MKAPDIRLMFERLRSQRPQPTTELRYHTPFELLVAVILSAQCTDVAVNKATDRLFARARTPKSLLALGVEGLIPYIRSIGLFNSKATNIIASCQILLERHGGQIPRNREALEALPGLGARPPTSFSTLLSVSRSSPWIPISSGLVTGPGWLQAKPFSKWKRNSCAGSRKNSTRMPITGLFCMAAIPALPAHRNATPASSPISARSLGDGRGRELFPPRRSQKRKSHGHLCPFGNTDPPRQFKSPVVLSKPEFSATPLEIKFPL